MIETPYWFFRDLSEFEFFFLILKLDIKSSIIACLCDQRNGYIKRFSYNCTTFGKNGKSKIYFGKPRGRRENGLSSLPSSVIRYNPLTFN